MSIEDIAYVMVDGILFDAWKSYGVDHDITGRSGQFDMSTTIPTRSVRDLKESINVFSSLVTEGAEVEVGVSLPDGKRVPQILGYTEKVSVEHGSEGLIISVSGRDRGRHLEENDADLSFKRDETFADMAERFCEPFGIAVTLDAKAYRDVMTGKRRRSRSLSTSNQRFDGIPERASRRGILDEADARKVPLDEYAGAAVMPTALQLAAGQLTPSQIRRLKVQDAKPQPGERIWDFLQRHASRLGLMMRMDTDGRLVISVPDYVQSPTYAFVRRLDGFTNVIRGTHSKDISSRVSEVRVTTFSRDDDGDRRRITAIGLDSDDPMPWRCTRRLQDDHVLGTDGAERMAYKAIADTKSGWRTVTYEVSGHGNNGAVIAPDTVAAVFDEVLGIKERMYVRARSLQRGDSGTVTRVDLIPLYSVIP